MFWAFSLGVLQAQDDMICGTDLYNQLFKPTQNSKTNSNTTLGLKARQAQDTLSDTLTVLIPVVVHVLHNDLSETPGNYANFNISHEQIQSQIDVLNEDYGRMFGTAGFNTNPVGANTKIKFCLAETDPNGLPTNGVTRHFVGSTIFNVSDNSLIKSKGMWPTDRYLNVWVCNMSSGILGYAQQPDSTGLSGLDDNYGNANEDGVVITTFAFGRLPFQGLRTKYNLGRSATHEIGHWLGLLHTFGDFINLGCNADGCNDTPPSFSPNKTNCNSITSTCNSTNYQVMIENYLDYSPDRCMNIFTKCQTERMRLSLANSPRRKKLLNSVATCSYTYPKYLTPLPPVVPAPKVFFMEDNIWERRLVFENQKNENILVKIQVYDVTGKVLYEKTLQALAAQKTFLPHDEFLETSGMYIVKMESNFGPQTLKIFNIIP